MAVQYKVQMFDGPRTMEQQTFLLAIAAKRAWGLWCSTADQPMQGISAEFDKSMQYLARQLQEVDIFMSGVHHGEK